MSDILSQNEIDALLGAVSAGDVDTSPAPAPAASPPASGGDSDGGGTTYTENEDWVAYDLTSQEQFVNYKFIALAGIHERFCRLFRITLSRMLNRTVSVSYKSTDHLKFGDYLATVLMPTSINVISMNNPRGAMVLLVGSKLTYALIDAYFGGTERPFSKIGGREDFTSVENSMIRRVVDLATKDLEEAWRLNYPVELGIESVESNPHFVGAIHASETVAVINFEIEFENLSGPFVVVLQLQALEPIRQYLTVNITREVEVDKHKWHQHWLRELATMPVSATVDLGHSKRSLRQIQTLQKGDVITLDQDASGDLTVQVEGISKFKGQMGVCHGSAAIRITDFLENK